MWKTPLICLGMAAGLALASTDDQELREDMLEAIRSSVLRTAEYTGKTAPTEPTDQPHGSQTVGAGVSAPADGIPLSHRLDRPVDGLILIRLAPLLLRHNRIETRGMRHWLRHAGCLRRPAVDTMLEEEEG